MLRYKLGALLSNGQPERASLVPSYTSPRGTMLVAHVHDQGEWFKESLQLVKEMCL